MHPNFRPFEMCVGGGRGFITEEIWYIYISRKYQTKPDFHNILQKRCTNYAILLDYLMLLKYTESQLNSSHFEILEEKLQVKKLKL